MNGPRTLTKTDLEAILDGLAEGIVALDDEGSIIGINLAACQILEIGKPDAMHTNCCELLGNQLCKRATAVRESILSRRPIDDVQVQVQTRSGRKKVLQFETRLLADTGKSTDGSVVLFRDVSELAALKEDLARRYRLHNIVGKSKPIQEVFRLIEEVADSDATVLIEGESGTGKELVARAIHHLGPRSDGAFVPVNCSALAEGVLESELFGHVKGAFTGAVYDKRGRFEAAEGGTIFLDEIGDTAPSIQVKLLRVLQERTIERVGSEESTPVDLRVIAATNRPLTDMIAEGSFRQDLFYRLRVVPIRLPALRERRDDIPLLAQHFVEKFRDETSQPIEGLSPEALTVLLDHTWPGNVRELENAVEYAFVKARSGQIGPGHLPPEIGTSGRNAVPAPKAAGLFAAAQSCSQEPDAADIAEVLSDTDWNVAKAARRLSLSRTTLYKRMAELGISRPVD